MKIRKLLRVLHRDFGYFIVGMTIVYGLSGIFLNHRHDFNPDYKIFITEFQVELPKKTGLTEKDVKTALLSVNSEVVYKKHYLNKEGIIKVFIENGEAVINPATGKGTMQYLQKRPIIYSLNKLHKASIGTVWKWVSDIMAVILIFVAVSGLFILKGKRGFNRWGWWLMVAGIVVPLVFALIYI
ncbi:MAG TPA: PepSY-associated TM helix domain-containing protein [Draconibacterium sp.]|nr:PepSY-associated TM helix domain-containing protein [Draconibacterium sp.]